MARDKYISVKQGISGFSFANLGLFTGFADGIYNAVYSLVLMEIFANSAVVGIYVAIYAAFCMFVGLFANELFRRFSKARVFYFSMLMLAICYAMMGFSVRPSTFVVLDYTTGIAITLVGILIPLFMSDFSEKVGMARLNSRYHLWLNVGALLAPMIALAIAEQYQCRYCLYAVLGGSMLVFVYVDLDDAHIVAKLFFHLHQHGVHHLARLAPCGEKVYQHQAVF